MAAARDFGLVPGKLDTGPLNAITDVPGVRIGHRDVRGDGIFTGVTSVLPHGGNLFTHKVRAAVEVINGFGKSAGLMQIAELGTIETPILLTNTFGVAACVDALIGRAIAANPQIGRATSTVNAVVCECNDGAINDIQAMAVSTEDALAALDAAEGVPVRQGAIGAGSGMTAFGFKAGIGSASRRMDIGSGRFIMGALALSNFGSAGDLILPDGRNPAPPAAPVAERGSVVVILATDLPLGERQLQRVARRGGAGLARLGALWGHSSGDISICFTTADPVCHAPVEPFAVTTRLDDAFIDIAFRAAVEATQEAVLNALCSATAIAGRAGRFFPSLADWLKEHALP